MQKNTIWKKKVSYDIIKQISKLISTYFNAASYNLLYKNYYEHIYDAYSLTE